MKKSETRILTTHTGSLPRPERLVDMLGSNRVEAGIVWLKLCAIREGADIASRELF